MSKRVISLRHLYTNEGEKKNEKRIGTERKSYLQNPTSITYGYTNFLYRATGSLLRTGYVVRQDERSTNKKE